MLHIVIDGAGDLPQAWLGDFAVHLLPLHVHFGDDSFTPGVDMDHSDFYRMVRQRRMIPKTSLPSIGQIAAFYREIAKKGDTILSIHISSKLSGTYNTVQTAAQELAGEINVIAFDSLAGSVAQGFMAREARLLDRSGASIQQIMERMDWVRDHIAILFTLDTLEFARLSGRIGAMQSVIASALQVKPIIVLRDGMLEVAEKVRTRKRALVRVLECLQERFGSQATNLAVAHAADPSTAAWMIAEARKRLNLRESVVTDVSIPIAANLGPGAIGCIAYPIHQREDETHVRA